MCGPEDPLFTPLLPLTRVPFQAKESVHKTPFWENLEILASTASIFTQILAHKPPNLEIFSSQAPKFGNFQLTSPQIWKFSAHKPPFSEANVSSQAPHHTQGRRSVWTLGGGDDRVARQRQLRARGGGCLRGDVPPSEAAPPQKLEDFWILKTEWRNLVNTFGQHFD